ncbi:MAG: AAA family ATPase [Defluviitaleaceae bacterium]|nr:AAA family ATPase [Defluviitaleaceae bacterium]
MRNIVLIGLPGSGKTTLGQKLAHRLGLDFVDVDAIIEEQADMPITQIFETHGESVFRQRENEAATQIAKLESTVIATGGGIVLREENMRLLCANGLVIFLDRNPKDIAADICNGGGTRPLLAQGEQRLYELARQRRGLYEQYADIAITVQGGIDGTLHTILGAIATRRNPLNAHYAVIGTPIAHSLSPQLHNPVLRKLSGRAEYSLVEVMADELADWVEYARKHMSGFNITMPHKESIIPMLDELHQEAAFCGSVNTAAVCGGRLIGSNTDMYGIEKALEQAGVSLRGTHVVIAGAGGAARTAVVCACVNGARRVTIAARNIAAAEAVMGAVSGSFPDVQIEVAEFCKVIETREYFGGEQADIFINATPLGMAEHDDFINFEFLDGIRTCVFDMVYNPQETSLLQAAQSKNLVAVGGLGMLIHQALRADEIFVTTPSRQQVNYVHLLACHPSKEGN